MVRDTSQNRPITHAEYVGIISASWAQLELIIDTTTWLIAGLRADVGACITANFLSIHPKLKSVIALCRLKGASESTLSELSKFHGRIYGTAEKRNRAVHDPWIPSVSPEGVKMEQWDLGIGKDVARMTRPAPIEELIEINREIHKRHSEFFKIREALFPELQASQENQPASPPSTRSDQTDPE